MQDKPLSRPKELSLSHKKFDDKLHPHALLCDILSFSCPLTLFSVSSFAFSPRLDEHFKTKYSETT